MTEIMEIWVASRLVKGPISVPYWHGCERAGKLKVVITHIFFSETSNFSANKTGRNYIITVTHLLSVPNIYCAKAVGLITQIQNIPYLQTTPQNEDGYAYQQLKKGQLLHDNSKDCHKDKRSCVMQILLSVNYNVVTRRHNDKYMGNGRLNTCLS
jgi:hypothetical protein